MSKPRQRPPMNVNPALMASGGLAARGGSVVEQIKDNPEAAAKLEEWAKSPALRVADSIGAEQPKPEESAVEPVASVTVAQTVDTAPPVPAPLPAAAAASAPVSEPAAALDDDEDYQPIPAVRKARPWQDMERQVREAVGIKGKNLPARVQADLYAKAWYLKETTAGLTWDSLIEEALSKHVNRKLKEMGYTP